MNLLAIILLALSLAMDCFSVSLTAGVCNKDVRFLSLLKMAFLFGFFQMMMPYIGYYAGVAFVGYIQEFDHWIAFGILLLIGLNMIFSKEKEDSSEGKDFFVPKTMLLLAIATSIDALATGLVFISERDVVSHHISFGIIGFTSFVVTFCGYYLGRWIGKKIAFRFEIVGGVILILIGAKILFEHLTA